MTDEHQPAADDAALSALLDGALPPADEEGLRQRLAREPALARRFDALRNADAAVRTAYAGLADEPLPNRILELLRAPVEDADEGMRVLNLGSRSRPKPAAMPFVLLPAAIAAGVAIVGLVITFLMLSVTRQPTLSDLIADAGFVERGTALYDLLQSGASAEAREIGPQTIAMPRITFVNMAREYCRLVEVTGARGTTHTLACRYGGDWRLELASFAALQPSSPAGVYRPATGETPAEIDAAIDAMIDGPPLGRAAEQEAISSGWAVPPAR